MSKRQRKKQSDLKRLGVSACYGFGLTIVLVAAIVGMGGVLHYLVDRLGPDDVGIGFGAALMVLAFTALFYEDEEFNK